jgi:hypothetical protein
LMEDGIISEDEFDEKKRELLDDFWNPQAFILDPAAEQHWA